MTENEKLRKLLTEAVQEIEDWAAYASQYFQERHDLPGTLARFRDALSQQAEPVEPAPAQDERDLVAETLEWYAGMGKSGARARTALAAYQATRPAQTEQQPVSVPEGWLIELGFDVPDRPFRFVDSKSHTPTIKVILPACEPDDSSSWFLRDEIARRIGSVLAAPIAQTEQQPEQIGLVEPTVAMVQAACAAFRMDVSPMVAMTEALRAALTAKGDT